MPATVVIRSPKARGSFSTNKHLNVTSLPRPCCRAYEYLLRKFAEGSGQSAGEFFTPTEVGFLMVHIMRPKPGEECHYASGSAGLLVKLQLVSRELDPTAKVPLKLYGQELTAESYAVAKMNAIIHDMTVEMARGDSIINPKFKTADSKIRTYDVVVANPMWNQPFNPDVFADGLHGRPRLQNTPPCREQRNSRRPGPGGEDGDLRCEDARRAARREGI